MRCIACGHEMLGPVCPQCGFRMDTGIDKKDDKNKKEDKGFFEIIHDEINGRK